ASRQAHARVVARSDREVVPALDSAQGELAAQPGPQVIAAVEAWAEHQLTRVSEAAANALERTPQRSGLHELLVVDVAEVVPQHRHLLAGLLNRGDQDGGDRPGARAGRAREPLAGLRQDPDRPGQAAARR